MNKNNYEHTPEWHRGFWMFFSDQAFRVKLDGCYAYLGDKPKTYWEYQL